MHTICIKLFLIILYLETYIFKQQLGKFYCRKKNTIIVKIDIMLFLISYISIRKVLLFFYSYILS